jgi:NADH-quinone oxidoreductase subunit C
MIKELENLKVSFEGNPNLRFSKVHLENDNLICECDTKNLVDNIVQLRKHPDFKFRQLVDILAVDYPNRVKRFELVYLLLSHEKNLRLSIKTHLEENEKAPTLTNVYPGANWLEREVFDMNGIVFEGHPDPRRILTDYGFEGHPLRKDFPLTGFKEVRYDIDKKKVVYGPVKLQQAYRDFDFKSPWQGPDYIKQEQDKAEKK